MKVLILEDSHERNKTFKRILKGHDLYFFDQVSDAVDAFNLMGPWDALFIDHDLDQKIYVKSSDPNTGYQFAKKIADKELPDLIIIHSMNIVGSQNIKNVLPTGKIIPFPNLIDSISS